jgi:tRNA (guanine37-N1)-methyltransferase
MTESIIGRARDKGLIDISIVDIREFTTNKHRKTDDYPFGGGAGMVMAPQPLFDALEALGTSGKRLVYMSPRGRRLDNRLVSELAAESAIIVLCGHYEGVDERVIRHFAMEEVSVGDYILTGGEIPAMLLIDAVARLQPDVIGNPDANAEESVYSGLLEYPQYTQPRDFRSLEVPEVLLSGNHKAIRLWKFEESLKLTMERRPDLFGRFLAENSEGGGLPEGKGGGAGRLGASEGTTLPGPGASEGAEPPGEGGSVGTTLPGPGASEGTTPLGPGAGEGTTLPGLGASEGTTLPGPGASEGAEPPGEGGSVGIGRRRVLDKDEKKILAAYAEKFRQGQDG